MKCIDCAKDIKYDEKLCPFCGATQRQEPLQPASVNAKPSRKQMLPVICVVVMIIVFVTACSGKKAEEPVLVASDNEPVLVTDDIEPIEKAPVMTIDDFVTLDDPNGKPESESSGDSASSLSGNFGQPKFDDIVSSSTRNPMGDGSGGTAHYDPGYARDGDWATAWCEGVDGPGVDEWIELRSSKSQSVQAIRVLNGYYKTERLFEINNKITRILITVDGNQEYTWDLTADMIGFQEFNFPSPVETTTIRLQMKNIATAGDAMDTLITEIEVV